MKLSDVKGKRIVGIRQGPVYLDDSGSREYAGWAVQALILDDGTEILFGTIETGYDSATHAYVRKPAKP